jgi:hypothetical protein
MLVFDTCTFTIDPTELEFEEPTEQAQVEDFTNLDWIKVSPGASNNYAWVLFITLS